MRGMAGPIRLSGVLQPVKTTQFLWDGGGVNADFGNGSSQLVRPIGLIIVVAWWHPDKPHINHVEEWGLWVVRLLESFALDKVDGATKCFWTEENAWNHVLCYLDLSTDSSTGPGPSSFVWLVVVAGWSHILPSLKGSRTMAWKIRCILFMPCLSFDL